ncbi:tyrosine-type recombinase/integrase [Geomonas nitrogeniifigens]|uniref:Tyrosine-type recombinase/integrase n=1 Tax=Geomonas diazotrophica TaxID=2843197 RepID=A0ABX8JFA2_9BACT|nr:tyrosine-type recombinase/integrase [Geomonas nitrogeniifigens]QWV96993.1 tyrosine-type recombinase/integrase [Geomonas nitrogeniifigens]
MNSNHPAKGSIISVNPIMDLKAIGTIKKILADNPRDSALFVVGINTALRASELLALTVGQVRPLTPGDTLAVREGKTGKERRITLNKAAHDAIQKLLATMPDAEGAAPLFLSRKGDGALTVPTLNNMVKIWCTKINLPGNYGSHTLRKTFGYHQRVTFNTDLPTLVKVFGHATEAQTLHYLCIQADEVKAAFMQNL